MVITHKFIFTMNLASTRLPKITAIQISIQIYFNFVHVIKKLFKVKETSPSTNTSIAAKI